MDEYLILNNGVTIEDAHCLQDDYALYVYITGDADLMAMLALFSVPENTEVIEATRYGERATYEGYTVLYSMSREYGNINLVMKKEM